VKYDAADYADSLRKEQSRKLAMRRSFSFTAVSLMQYVFCLQFVGNQLQNTKVYFRKL